MPTDRISKWLIGGLLNAAYGIIIGMYLGRWIVSLTGIHSDKAPIALAVMLAITFVVVSMHNTKTAHKGVLYVLGMRLRVGPGGLGYTEGWVIPFLPWPLAFVEDVDCRELSMKFKDMPVYSVENVLAHLDSLLQFQVVDPYVFLSSATPIQALESIALTGTRTEISERKLDDLPKSKSDIGDNVQDEIREAFHADPETPGPIKWGIKLLLYRIEHVSLPADYETAKRRIVTEPVERIAEMTQTDARRDQIKKLVEEAGLDPNHAAVIALKDAGKDNVQVISVIGFEGIGDSLKKFGEAAKRFVTPPAP